MAARLCPRSYQVLPASPLSSSTAYRICAYLQPSTACLRKSTQQHFLIRSYATAKGKIRSKPRNVVPQRPSRPLPISRSSPTTTTNTSATTPSPSPTTPPAPASYIPISRAFAQTLASKNSPTLLYLAPTSNTYMLTCYALSGFCIAYGAINFYDQIIAPRSSGLWWAIPVSIGGVSLLTAALGVRVGMSARRLVQSVTAVPTTKDNGGVLLRLEARTLLAVFGKGQVVDVPLVNARLSRKIAPEQDRKPAHTTSQGFAARREEEQRRKKEREYELNHLWSAPFRHFASAAGRVVSSLQRMVWREGFVQIIVDGRQVWRVDAKSGWALDEGVALDRLIGPLGGRK